MKKLIVLLAFLIPFILKAQQKVTITPEVAQKLTKMIQSCDSTKEVLDLTKQQLKLTQKKVVLKDSIINQYVVKDSIYKEMLHNEELKYMAQSELVYDLEKKNAKLIRRGKNTKIISTVITLGMTLLTIIK
jgi:hypothetical protein